ncbi:hypothetical protein BKA63DRAFT_534760 [Paraphoma chrysanthemicola]|nr:hypothetical protein BKA63DRAFT_534760 [Paraphoma chrysanthemicola]
MADQINEHAASKFRYELLFGTWLLVTGATFLRISKQPYSSRLKIEQYESIFKGTSLSAVLLGIGMTPDETLSTMQIVVGSVSVDFDWWNPVYAVAPFVLVLLSLPLAVFAFFTTVFAGSLLFLRVAIVYAQLVTAIIGTWLFPQESRPSVSLQRSPISTSPTHHRNRRMSHTNVSSASSSDTIAPATTPKALQGNIAITTTEETGEITRDFEGIGGWRDPGDESEEALWLNMNSRLQLPAVDSPRRHHKRRLTGGGSPTQRHSWSPEASRTSPAHSRARTPVRYVRDDDGDYFPPQPLTTVRPTGSASNLAKQHRRRKSGSGSSASTTTPGPTAAVKIAGD